MKYFIYLITFAFAISTVASIHNYYISDNNVKCALLSLSANLRVQYEATDGIKIVNVSLGNSTADQSGKCADAKSPNSSQFNISMNLDQNLTFNFENLDGQVFWKNITFIFNLPNSDFPNATKNGTIISTATVNQSLSSPTQYYKCFSDMSFNLSDGVTFEVHQIKVKVFNVFNSSFGDDVLECEKDLTTPGITSTSASTVQSTSPVSSTSTVTTTTHSSRSTPVTSVPTTNSPTTSVTTTTSTEPTTTSTEPKTTSTSENTTPKASTTITKASITTTSERTTTKSISTSTSAGPTTTTIAPYDPKFEIKNGATICLLVQGQMTLSVSYEASKNTATKLFPITTSYEYSGNCSAVENYVIIKNSSDLVFNLTFIRSKGKTSLSQFDAKITLSHRLFPDAKKPNDKINSTAKFNSNYEVAGSDQGYYCKTNITLIGSSGIKLELKEFRFEAFRNSTSSDFSSKVTTCKTSSSNDSSVAIIVGIVLAVFLVIVICLFIFFQIRARRRQGYQQI